MIELISSVQGQRLHLEQLRDPIHGAAGIRAQLYPHQLWAVHEILSAPRVRHLVSAEVGMGKTIIVMMVINALYLQNPNLQVQVFVPPELLGQWYEEWARRMHRMPAINSALMKMIQGQIKAAYHNNEESKALMLRLSLSYIAKTLEEPVFLNENYHIKPFSQLNKLLSNKAPEKPNIIIVDEPQRLTALQRRQLRSAAKNIPEILLLSATLDLTSPRQLGEYLSILCPQDFEAYHTSQGYFIESEWPNDLMAQFAIDKGNSLKEQHVTELFRKNWSQFFPSRRHLHHTVEASETELTIFDNFQQLLSHPHFPPNISKPLLVQRSIRSLASLQERLQVLTQLNGLRSPVQTLSEPDLRSTILTLIQQCQDSCLLALADLLVEIWEKEPNSKILIAAEDSPTVRHVAHFLQQYFEGSSHVQGIETLQELPDVFGAVRSFTNESSILIMKRELYTGLNLQVTRHIIFFAVPLLSQSGVSLSSNLQDIEQLIGRIDRLGNKVIQQPGWTPKPICVHTISRHRTIQDRAVKLLQKLGFFTASYASLATVDKVFLEHFPLVLQQDTGWETLFEHLHGHVQPESNKLTQTLQSDKRIQQGRQLVQQVLQDTALEPAVKSHHYLHPVSAQVCSPPEYWWQQGTHKERALLGWLQAMYQKDSDKYMLQPIKKDTRKAIKRSHLSLNPLSLRRWGWGHIKTLDTNYHFEVTDADGIQNKVRLYLQPFRHDLHAAPTFLTPAHEDNLPSPKEWIASLEDEVIGQQVLQKIRTWRWVQFLGAGDNTLTRLIKHWQKQLNSPDLPSCFASIFMAGDPLRKTFRYKGLSIQIHWLDLGARLVNSQHIQWLSPVSLAEALADQRLLRRLLPPNMWSSHLTYQATEPRKPIEESPVALAADSILNPKRLNAEGMAVGMPSWMPDTRLPQWIKDFRSPAKHQLFRMKKIDQLDTEELTSGIDSRIHSLQQRLSQLSEIQRAWMEYYDTRIAKSRNPKSLQTQKNTQRNRLEERVEDYLDRIDRLQTIKNAISEKPQEALNNFAESSREFRIYCR